MNRYSRQLLYKNIGKQGQKRLLQSHVVIVGVGALGSVCSELLTRSGIGNVTVIDRDFIELNNLQRQTLFSEKDIGKAKADVAKNILSKINSEIRIKAISTDLTYKNINLIGKPDLILGCTDNMESRFLINDYSLENKIPWIYGGAVSDKGMVFNIIPGQTCLRCIFKGIANDTCDTIGILNSNSMVIGSLMANEALKILLNKDFEKQMIHIDIWKNNFHKIKVKKRKNCPACRGKYDYLTGEKTIKTTKMCGKGMYQMKSNMDFDELKKRLPNTTISFSAVLHYNNLSIFKDGRVMIKAKNVSKARSIYSKFIGN